MLLYRTTNAGKQFFCPHITLVGMAYRVFSRDETFVSWIRFCVEAMTLYHIMLVHVSRLIFGPHAQSTAKVLFQQEFPGIQWNLQTKNTLGTI